jgi:hypothetical protein
MQHKYGLHSQLNWLVRSSGSREEQLNSSSSYRFPALRTILPGSSPYCSYTHLLLARIPGHGSLLQDNSWTIVNVNASLLPTIRISRQTRSSTSTATKFIIPKCKTCIHQRSFFIWSTRIWHLLADELDWTHVAFPHLKQSFLIITVDHYELLIIMLTILVRIKPFVQSVTLFVVSSFQFHAACRSCIAVIFHLFTLLTLLYLDVIFNVSLTGPHNWLALLRAPCH